MGIIGRIKRRKYFSYTLDVNTGDGWKKFGDYKVFLGYKDLDEPDPGSLLRLYGNYKDLSRKEGFGREVVWEKLVPMPGGAGRKAVAKKEQSIEDRLMEKVVEHADFTHLQPSKLSIPFGKAGASLELQATPGGGNNPYGEIPPISFEGNLPAWLHPAAGALIVNLMEKGGDFLRKNISGAITDATGIKEKKDTGNKKDTEQPIDPSAQLHKLLDNAEAEEQEIKKNKENVKEKNKRE